jgi:hypothetical protein
MPADEGQTALIFRQHAPEDRGCQPQPEFSIGGKIWDTLLKRHPKRFGQSVLQ